VRPAAKVQPAVHRAILIVDVEEFGDRQSLSLAVTLLRSPNTLI
jgi:hypothetical protein